MARPYVRPAAPTLLGASRKISLLERSNLGCNRRPPAKKTDDFAAGVCSGLNNSGKILCGFKETGRDASVDVRWKRAMALAIILGALSGALAFLPLYWGLRRARLRVGSSSLGQGASLIIAAVLSFLVLMVATVLCLALARNLLAAFGLAEAIALCVTAIVYGVWKMVRR